jgi:predicted nucleic acid-binding protein
VLDASVAIKWLLSGEPNEEEAIKVKNDYVSGAIALYAPAFLIQEVTNSVWRAIKLKRITREFARSALDSLGDLQINFSELKWSEACEELAIAIDLDLAIYDSAYLFLSKKLNAKLITADEKMYKKAKEHFKIIRLSDYV